MKVFSLRNVFLLLGILCLIVVYRKYSVRSEAAGGSREAAGGEQVNWENLTSAAQEIEAPCSLRNAVRDDTFLRKRFVFSLPVLQWAGSLSTSTWKELNNRAPPYGWRGLPVTVLQATLPLLSSSRLFDRNSPGRCVRCAVVGNGGILQGSRQGRDIDGHDFVFRMNGAVISGFEEDVGTKVSFYGFTTNTLKHALILYRSNGFSRVPQNPDIKYIFIPSDIRDYVMMEAAVHGQSIRSGRDKGDRPSSYFGHKPPESFKMLHPEFISYLMDSFLSSPLLTDIRTRDLYMPSTGALMLLTALHTCDQVSAYGFITRNYAAFSDHYYDLKPRPLRFFANHDLQMEGRLWEALHLRRILWLYQRGGGS